MGWSSDLVQCNMAGLHLGLGLEKMYQLKMLPLYMVSVSLQGKSTEHTQTAGLSGSMVVGLVRSASKHLISVPSLYIGFQKKREIKSFGTSGVVDWYTQGFAVG